MSTRTKKIKSLSFAGGGMFGFSHVGALKELEKYSQYLDIQEVRGSSVGSMVASLYAVGYTTDELTAILHEIDFDNLVKDNYFAYYNLYHNLGMYHANKLEEKMEELIRNKTNIKFCTFSQIEKNLIIITTNLNYQRPRFLDRTNTPDLPISKAVRMSIGYPGIVKPVLFEGDYYGDAGISINYPLTTIPSDKLHEAIGITFSAYNENPDGTLKNRVPINNITDFFKSLGLTLSRSAYTSQLKEEHLSRSIVIAITQEIASMQFNLTKEQKQFIYDCGIQAVREQIHNILDIANNHLPKIDTIPVDQKENATVDKLDNLLETLNEKTEKSEGINIEQVIDALVPTAILNQ